jgi:uncharacterized repeat protein (TIGR01451 family)
MRSSFRRNALLLAVLAAAFAATSGTAWALGTPAGTPITNQATVTYNDPLGNSFTALSNVVTTVVSQVASVDVAPDNATTTTPSTTVTYAHTVSNLGNGPDSIDITTSSSQGWTVALYFDLNGDGLYQVTDPALGDTDGDLTPDTGVLAANGTYAILARVTVPAGTVGGTVDVTTVTGTSTFNNAISESATDTTSIQAPNLTAVKSVAPVGNQPPGTVLTYSVVVTNTGNTAASSVVLTDAIPANTTYVAGSIVYNGTPQSDLADLDSGDYNGTNPNAVTVNVGALAVAGSVTIEFQVTID